MYYRISVREGNFNLMDPSEASWSNWIGIFDKEKEMPIKAVSVIADSPIFFDEDTPEDIANALEKWLKGAIYTSDEEKIKDMIQYLRKHSKELLKGRLDWRIALIEEKIKRLEEDKKWLLKVRDRV